MAGDPRVNGAEHHSHIRVPVLARSIVALPHERSCCTRLFVTRGERPARDPSVVHDHEANLRATSVDETMTVNPVDILVAGPVPVTSESDGPPGPVSLHAVKPGSYYVDAVTDCAWEFDIGRP
jgi:hypothetical protein